MEIRPSVTAFAGLSFALKAALVLLLLARAVLPAPLPGPSVLLVLFAAVVLSTFARSLWVGRLNPTERAVVQYWSLAPLLIVMVVGALGALPILVLGQLADRFAWSATALRNLNAFILAGTSISAAILIWVYWKQFRVSLPS